MSSARPRMALALCVATLAALVDADARADKKACLAAADAGQNARDAGRLVEARDHFAACATRSCPGIVRTDCAAWLADVDKRVPSVVVAVRDASGRDVAGAEVTIDDKPAPRALEGASTPLDPGTHRFVVRRGEATASASIVLREGEQDRRVEVKLDEEPARAPIATTSRAPLYVVFGGVAALGAAGFIGLGVAAKSQRDGLATTCAPRCAPSDVDGVRAKMIAANVAFGVGVAGLAALAITFLTAPSAPTPRAAKVPAPFLPRFALAPIADGAGLGLERAW